MTPARTDYYDVLGVAPDAGADEIRRAFRARARVLHPDVSSSGDAVERFSELAEAYSVLSGSTSRLLYDRFGYRGRGHGGFAASSRQGRRRAEAEARQAAGLAAEVEVGFFEAARGATVTARLAGTVACPACDGAGEAPGDPQRCQACEGTGRLQRTSSVDFGRLLQIERCYRCEGRGTVPVPCPACAGDGEQEVSRDVEVALPPRTVDGQRIALAGAGEIVVRVLPPPREHPLVRLVAIAGLALALVLLVVVLLS